MTAPQPDGNPEYIDKLVDHSLSQPIVDDYSVNRYERCKLCGGEWHGLPNVRSCPGAWGSETDKNLEG